MWSDCTELVFGVGSLAGGPRKLAALRAALRTGLITELVTDEHTAKLLMDGWMLEAVLLRPFSC